MNNPVSLLFSKFNQLFHTIRTSFLLLICLFLVSTKAINAQTDTIFRSFTTGQVNDGVLINFTVLKGISCTGVQIERSEDNIHFTEIHEFAGVCGAINSEESYSYTDTDPVKNKTSWYRLDLGSIGLFSATRNIKFIDYSAAGVIVFPNPCKANCAIYFSNRSQEKLELVLYDRLGKPVIEEATNSDRWQPSTQNLPNGIYFYKISRQGEVRHAGKLVVL